MSRHSKEVEGQCDCIQNCDPLKRIETLMKEYSRLGEQWQGNESVELFSVKVFFLSLNPCLSLKYFLYC